MTVLIVVGVVALYALVLALTWRLNRTPRDMRGDCWSEFEREFRAYAKCAEKVVDGDWWPQFESEFRAYAARAANAADDPRRRTRGRESRPG
jgi:uncharacterized protein HemY